MNADGGRQTRLTNDPAFDQDPAWSPNGATVVFTSDRSGRKQLWSMNADGSSPAQLTDAANIGGENAAWSPNGRTIVFDSDRDELGNLDVYEMNPDGSNVRRVTQSGALDALPTFSPDGRTILFESDRTAKNNRELFALRDGAAESQVRRVTHDRMSSADVDREIKQADDLATRYQVEGTPAFALAKPPQTPIPLQGASLDAESFTASLAAALGQ